MAEAVAHPAGEEGGGRAQTPPPKRRPGTCAKVAARRVTCYGQGSRAVGVPSSRQQQRRQQALARARQAAAAPREAAVREAGQPEYGCHAAAEAAATTLRALQSASHQGEVGGEERPT
jgi:hypothetical protein